MNEWAGIGNFNEFKERGQDSRIGRFLSVDPIANKYPWNSTYAFAENSPILGIDLEGLELLKVNSGWFKMQTSGGNSKIIVTKEENIPSAFKNAAGRPLFTPASVGMTNKGMIDFNKGPVFLPSNNLPAIPSWQYSQSEGEPTNNIAGGYIGADVDRNRAFADQAAAVAAAPSEVRSALKTIQSVPIWNAYGSLGLNERKFSQAISITNKYMNFSNTFDSKTSSDVINFIYDGDLPNLNYQDLKGSLTNQLNIMDMGMHIMKKEQITIQPSTQETYKSTTELLKSYNPKKTESSNEKLSTYEFK